MNKKNNRVLYFDAFSGMSGDMTLAALIDAGADFATINDGLQQLIPGAFSLKLLRVKKHNLSALKLEITFTEPHKEHHRHFTDIKAMIETSGLEPPVVQLAIRIFTLIGQAEAKIHDLSLEKVHFHEVGALDSIIDIVGVALALHALQLDKIFCSPLPLGSGFTDCDHGKFPVPAPAALEILRGFPIKESSLPFELTTPTGAGIAVAVSDNFLVGLPRMKVRETGYGAGTFDLPNQPNVLRVVLGETE